MKESISFLFSNLRNLYWRAYKKLLTDLYFDHNKFHTFFDSKMYNKNYLKICMIVNIDYRNFFQISSFFNFKFYRLDNQYKQTSDNCYYVLPNIMAIQNSENEDFKEPIIISLGEIAIRLKNAL